MPDATSRGISVEALSTTGTSPDEVEGETLILFCVTGFRTDFSAFVISTTSASIAWPPLLGIALIGPQTSDQAWVRSLPGVVREIPALRDSWLPAGRGGAEHGREVQGAIAGRGEILQQRGLGPAAELLRPARRGRRE
jgi:hypothetical protein